MSEDLDRVKKLRTIIDAQKRLPPDRRIDLAAAPMELDLSECLYYIRWQGGEGCWGYSLLSIWDIMNEIECPYSPNLSLNLGLFLHRRRDLWEYECIDRQFNITKKKAPQGIYSQDGRFHVKKFPDKGEEKWLEQSFGCTTEGTELTNPTGRWTGYWTEEGTNEAYNYRLASDIEEIPISSFDFIQNLRYGYPIQLGDGGHVVAVVGYNRTNKTFKFVNSYGDRYGSDGFYYYSFSQIDNKKGFFGDTLDRAFIIHPITPKSVPVARIKVTTPKDRGRRLNVNLWLSAENSPLPKRKIWPPCDSGDDSKSLHYTVRLPSEFIWPPSPENRLILDFYNSGAFSETAGTLETFTVAFGEHIFKCTELSNGPVSINALDHRRFSIP